MSITLKLELKQKGLTGEQLRAQLIEIKSIGYRKLGERFHRVNLPRRFTWSGGRMLGYARRSPKYTKKKFKQLGHGDPLRWSDVSRKLATSIEDIRVKSSTTRTEVRIVIHARGLNRRHKKSSIRMQDEVRSVAQREYGPLVRFLKNEIDQEMKRRELR
jgi:hypothetical protein